MVSSSRIIDALFGGIGNTFNNITAFVVTRRRRRQGTQFSGLRQTVTRLSTLGRTTIHPNGFRRHCGTFFMARQARQAHDGNVGRQPLTNRFAGLTTFFFPNTCRVARHVQRLLRVIFSLTSFHIQHRTNSRLRRRTMTRRRIGFPSAINLVVGTGFHHQNGQTVHTFNRHHDRYTTNPTRLRHFSCLFNFAMIEGTGCYTAVIRTVQNIVTRLPTKGNMSLGVKGTVHRVFHHLHHIR